MEKLIFTFLIFWILWKVLKKGIDELQARMDEQIKRQQKQTPQRRPASTQARAPIRREPAELERGPRIPAKEEAELERLLMEAIRRKDQLETGDEGLSLTTSEEEVFEPPRPRQSQVIYREAVTRHVEPHAEHRREVRVERRSVAVPREPVASMPAQKRLRHPQTTARRKGERPRRRMARQRSSAVDLAGIGRLGKQGVRRGIIMAEILGPPKALRDIDTHVI